MGFFVAMGVFSLIVGLLFIISPATLRAMNEKASTMVTSFEEKAFTYRLGVGVSLIIASLLFFFVAYYIRIRGGL
ncbi:MAG: hypothetical protein HZB54_09815 [Deltaproteobacteria bacterium]|nr:hypothetical protein [Deltaproteobacteria bacterium]